VSTSRKASLAAFVLLLLLLAGSRASGLEVGVQFDLGNLGFKADRDRADTTYSAGDFLWGGSLHFAHALSDNITLKGSFFRDGVLRNAVDASLYYDLDFLTLGVGTFNGLFNSSGTVLKPGISTSMLFGIPGVIFVNLQTASSIGGQLIENGDYLQEKTDFFFGFYVHNAICSLGIQSKKFIERKSTTLEIVNSLLDYSFKTDIYQKNQPYHLILTFSYQTLSKRYDDATPNVHTLNSVILGTELDINLTSYLLIRLNVESSVYTFGADDLSEVSSFITDAYFFRAHTGFVIDFAKLKEKRQAFTR
jgi:hypothetical protein